MLRQLASRVMTIRAGSLPLVQQWKTMVTKMSYSPSNLEKRFLVWTGKYKQVADVPAHISPEEMERCRNKVRIRLANIMIALTVVGCIVMVYSGKQAAKKGDSVLKQNLEWHKQYNERTQEKPTSE